jgi:hypothetical protein
MFQTDPTTKMRFARELVCFSLLFFVGFVYSHGYEPTKYEIRKYSELFETGPDPEQIHLSVGAPGFVVVKWISWVNSELPFAEYGSTSELGLKVRANASTYDVGRCVLDEDCGWKGWIFTATVDVSQFVSGSHVTFFYRVGTDSAMSSITQARLANLATPTCVAIFGMLCVCSCARLLTSRRHGRVSGRWS